MGFRVCFLIDGKRRKGRRSNQLGPVVDGDVQRTDVEDRFGMPERMLSPWRNEIGSNGRIFPSDGRSGMPERLLVESCLVMAEWKSLKWTHVTKARGSVCGKTLSEDLFRARCRKRGYSL